MNDIETSVGRSHAAFVIHRDWAGSYAWSLRDAHGQTVETSTARFDSREACREAIDHVRRCASTAVIN